MSAHAEATRGEGEGGRRRASLSSILPRLRSASPRSGSDASAPVSPMEVVVRVGGVGASASKTDGGSRSASKLHAATASSRCESCGKPFSVLRRASVCCHCMQRVCAGCLAPASSQSPTVSPPASPPSSPSMKLTSCAECAKIGVFERQLARSFFSTSSPTSGKRALYPGLSRACYRQWFHERCGSAICRVQATEKKRARMIRKLHDRQLLHSPKWIEPCVALRDALGVAVCYVSLASDTFELIVGCCGDMLHFSCFPREIGMCDQVLGAADPLLVLYDATERSASIAGSIKRGAGATASSKVPAVVAYRHNPFLVLAKAGFYAAKSIIVHGVGIGVVALLDQEPRRTPLTDHELGILASACLAISERVARIVSRPRSSPAKAAATPEGVRCMVGVCATPSIR